MHALITGGAGAIGVHVAERMLELGDRVTLIDLPGESSHVTALQQRFRAALVRHNADLAEPRALHSVPGISDVAVMIHLASMRSAASDRDPGQATRVNLLGGTHVFEAARDLGIPRLVCASSITVYGADSDYCPDELPLDESAGLRVAEGARLYGAGKVYLEALAEAFAHNDGPFVVGLRPSIVYGGLARAKPEGWLDVAVASAASGQETTIEDGDRSMNLVHVLDVADQFVALAHAPLTAFPAPSTFFNSGGDACTVAEVADEIAAACPGVKVTVIPGAAGPMLGIATSLDGTAIEAIVGHPRKFPLQRGIRQYIDSFRATEGRS